MAYIYIDKQKDDVYLFGSLTMMVECVDDSPTLNHLSNHFSRKKLIEYKTEKLEIYKRDMTRKKQESK